ncbi:zinc finger protein 181-like [Lucilia sericata]|uniref:zinc finger protein 181-like n=1 Tax=Lucilia sericata TaxID=13632 RepID=UPI0018A8734C|nr:zinc finger protein 181-like [Lucilia sericata]
MSSQNNIPVIAKNVDNNEQTPNKIAYTLLEDLQKEQNLLTNDFPICKQLIEGALERFYATGIAPGCELYADVLNQKLIKIHQKLVLPTNLNKINFTVKERCLKQLEDKTQCKIQIKGRNSMLDTTMEEELRLSGDVRYKHLKRNLYLELTTEATPIECYTRMAHALAEIRFLILDKNELLFEDELSEEIKIETEVTGERLDHDPLQIVFNEPMPAPDINKPQTVETKTPMFSLANKLIKLLDETVLNPNFQQTEEENTNISQNIDSFIASKEPINNFLSTASSTNVETINITNPSIKTRSQSKIKNLNKTKKRITKRKLTKSTYKTKLVKTSFKAKNSFAGIFYIKDKTTNKIIKRQIFNKTTLSRCLKRSDKEITQTDNEVLCEPFTIDYLQKNPTEIVFEYTPRDIIISLLDTMKNYPVLWEFHNKPFNEDFNEAIEDLCQEINNKWSLQIDSLKMRRSINRILRFYRFLFPFESMEKFSDYFEICAGFMPSTVNEIPYARCSHCFLCFKYDSELRRHLSDEHKSLNYHYKCKYCGERYADSQEYEFHKHLPHYEEIFHCDHCHERFNRRNYLTRHLIKHETNPVERRNHVCDLCGKKFKSGSELSNHKLYHEEKKFKCNLCSKSYFKDFTLMLHMKTHRNQYDFICEVCGKAFTQQKLLNEHLVIHNDIQITCNICNLKLRKRNLLRHLRSIHVAVEGTIESTFRAKGHRHNELMGKKRVFKPRTKSGKISNHSIEPNARQYNCKLCNIPFERLKFLKEHNVECHTNINKVACKICDSHLIHRNNIRRHYREKHKIDDDKIDSIHDEETDNDIVLSMTIEKMGEL